MQGNFLSNLVAQMFITFYSMIDPSSPGRAFWQQVPHVTSSWSVAKITSNATGGGILDTHLDKKKRLTRIYGKPTSFIRA